MASETEKTIELEKKIDEDLEIPQTRKQLLIFLIVQWSLFLFLLWLDIYALIMDDSGPIVLERDSLWIFLSILIFYSFGIGFTYSCQSLGLLIFSWIGVALAIVVTLFIGYLILTIIALGSVFNARNEAYIIGLIIAVIMILLIYVWVKTFKKSFHLARLIKLKNEVKD